VVFVSILRRARAVTCAAARAMLSGMNDPARYRVLGIDPGLNITGYGAVDVGGRDPVIVEAGTLRTDARAELADRIEQIHADLREVLAELKPDLVAVEQLYAHYKHPRTSILMAHARGVVLLAARQAGVPVRSIAATAVKKNLTGNGHASKLQVQRAIQGLCRLAEVPEPPDVADAIAIALCAARKAGPA
jgi:crossover junction endodeoxyribonuclease RuvC